MSKFKNIDYREYTDSKEHIDSDKEPLLNNINNSSKVKYLYLNYFCQALISIILIFIVTLFLWLLITSIK